MGIKEFYTEDVNYRRVFAVDWNFTSSDTVNFPHPRKDLKDNPFLLKIFHINDLHCNIYSFSDDYSSRPVFSKIVNEVEKERKNSMKSPNTGVLFLSAGDDSTGSAMDHLTGYNGNDFICHPAYTAYGLAGMDVTVLGNHDFDTGLNTLKKSIINDTAFPILSANLKHDGELDGLVYPGAIIIIQGVRIGIIGLTTPGQIRSREGSVFSITDPLETVEKLYNKLIPVCDSVIILSHLGYKLGSTFAAVKSMGDMELASGLKDQKIDLIVGGHTHDFLNINGLEIGNIVNDIPVLQAGFNGLFFGKTILEISDQNSLINTSVLPTGNLSSNKDFDKAYEGTVAGRNISTLKKTLGYLNFPDEYKDANYDIYKNSFENPMANFITDSLCSVLRKKGQEIDFTLIDGSSMMKFFDINGKTVNSIDIYKLMPYADTIVLITIDGRKLENIIIENALRVNRDYTHNLERGFLHFSKEIRYKIDIEGNNAMDIFINGNPIEDSYEELFIIAMPNYVQGLSKNWQEYEEMLGMEISGFNDIPKRDIGLYVRNEFLGYLTENGVSKDSGFLIDGRLKII
jgi:2',3'-cyclic-nucleotide 2'-phosphodiesterase (5'-nucleotidase family)